VQAAAGTAWGISMRRLFQFVIACVISISIVAPLHGDDQAALKAKLSLKGIRVTHLGLSLTEEVELAKQFRQLATLKRKLQSAVREFNETQRGLDELNENLHQRMRANVAINGQLATSGNLLQRNQLIGAANATAGEINLLNREQEESKKELDRTRAAANSVREKYAQQVAKIRAEADHVAEKYAELEKDEEAQSTLKEWNAAAKSSLEIKPSRLFQAGLKRIADLEKTVVSEKIPLRREGNSLFATVVVNGDHVVDMVVDTGASSLVLPYRTAMECGAKIDSTAMPVQMIVASGAKFKSKLVTLDSVKVGQFSAQKVECIVLPPEATNAPILLGMTFLGRFNFSINGTDLVLSKIDGELSTTERKSGRSPKKKVRNPDPESGD
jgi:clan AA aspartic protease (TIGR02281 family)